MKRFSYGERDYAFGQAMLSLRTTIGLTQAGLADLLGVSRRAVGEWEAGSSYPTAHHLQHVMTLAVQQHAFPPGREAQEIRALWKAAHQKVLLDEQWLSALLNQPSPPPAPVPVEEAQGAAVVSAPPLLPAAWPRHRGQQTVRCRLCQPEEKQLLLVVHGWIGVRRWMCRASMGAKGS